jgi:hypothetical protein
MCVSQSYSGNMSCGLQVRSVDLQPALLLPCRNFTITGLPGTTPLLDLNRQAGVVQICSTCVLQIANISLANLTRSGSGVVTFFRGQLGARMVQQNAYSVRLVCQETDMELAVMNQTQRSSRFPNPAGEQQLTSSVNVTYQASVCVLCGRLHVQLPCRQGCLIVLRVGYRAGRQPGQWFQTGAQQLHLCRVVTSGDASQYVDHSSAAGICWFCCSRRGASSPTPSGQKMSPLMCP